MSGCVCLGGSGAVFGIFFRVVERFFWKIVRSSNLTRSVGRKPTSTDIMLTRSLLITSRQRWLGRALSTTTVPIFQLDAFADRLFSGNPAAVIPLAKWLPDATLLQIAAENNLSETAFYVPSKDRGADYHLRWFTPTLEVDMCGHATLATAALILGRLEPQRPSVTFETRSGNLVVNRTVGSPTGPSAGSILPQLTLDFPPWPAAPEAESPPPELVAALNGPSAPTHAFPIEPLHGAPYFLFLYESAEHVRSLKPSHASMTANVVATAPGSAVEAEGGIDFVSRFFGPLSGIPEDPATGSAHMTLAPFWASRLGKRVMEAQQLSARGARLRVEVDDQAGRVFISGEARLYMEGKAHVPVRVVD